MNNQKTIILKLVCAIALAGEVLRAGSLVEVTIGEAKDLLRRGKAEVHNHDPESGDEVFASGGVDPVPHPDLADFSGDVDADADAVNIEAAVAAAPEAAADIVASGGVDTAATVADAKPAKPAKAAKAPKAK